MKAEPIIFRRLTAPLSATDGGLPAKVGDIVAIRVTRAGALLVDLVEFRPQVVCPDGVGGANIFALRKVSEPVDGPDKRLAKRLKFTWRPIRNQVDAHIRARKAHARDVERSSIWRQWDEAITRARDLEAVAIINADERRDLEQAATMRRDALLSDLA